MRQPKAWRAFAVLIIAALAAAAAPEALAATLGRDGFALPNTGAVTVVVFRPDVQVGSLRVGGIDDANADWTKAARDNIQHAMAAAGEVRGVDVKFLGDPDGPDADLVNDYRALFAAVAAEAYQHTIVGNRLPSKLVAPASASGPRAYRFDYTLGADARRLKAVTGGDYALFFFTHDAYGDAGRKVAQLLMAGLFGAYMQAGVHIGYAGLVDLTTGDLVWLNFDPAMGGDVRTAEGANKRVAELLAGFPRRGAGSAPAAPPPPPAPTAAPAAAAPATR